MFGPPGDQDFGAFAPDHAAPARNMADQMIGAAQGHHGAVGEGDARRQPAEPVKHPGGLFIDQVQAFAEGRAPGQGHGNAVTIAVPVVDAEDDAPGPGVAVNPDGDPFPAKLDVSFPDRRPGHPDYAARGSWKPMASKSRNSFSLSASFMGINGGRMLSQASLPE